MKIIKKFLDKIRYGTDGPPPIIDTAWGPVSERARLQAVTNMRKDPVKLLQVQSLVIKECGGDVAKGKAEFKRRYPEVFE